MRAWPLTLMCALFLPREPELADKCKAVLEAHLGKSGFRLIGWRAVPVQNDEIGHTAKQSEPQIAQVFLAPIEAPKAEEADPTVRLEKMCYLLRKRSAQALKGVLTEGGREWSSGDFYWCSLSSRTVVYKGMLRSLQVLGPFSTMHD